VVLQNLKKSRKKCLRLHDRYMKENGLIVYHIMRPEAVFSAAEADRVTAAVRILATIVT